MSSWAKAAMQEDLLLDLVESPAQRLISDSVFLFILFYFQDLNKRKSSSRFEVPISSLTTHHFLKFALLI